MKLWKYTTSLILLSLTGFAYAVSSYQIDLIVFSQITPDNFSHEYWPQVATTDIDLKGATSVNYSAPPDVTPIDSSNSQLKREFTQIRKTSPYKIILHASWQESLAQLDRKTTFHLYGGKLYDSEGRYIDSNVTESIPFDQTQQWELNGTVTVKLDRYFDFDFNLLFAEPYEILSQLSDKVDNMENQTFKYFKLEQTRRTRSTLLNYIDHPLYGILFKVTPIKTQTH